MMSAAPLLCAEIDGIEVEPKPRLLVYVRIEDQRDDRLPDFAKSQKAGRKAVREKLNRTSKELDRIDRIFRIDRLRVTLKCLCLLANPVNPENPVNPVEFPVCQC
jgi:hypothetical protein